MVAQADGTWTKSGLKGAVTVTPSLSGHAFTPTSKVVSKARSSVNFAAAPILESVYWYSVRDSGNFAALHSPVPPSTALASKYSWSFLIRGQVSTLRTSTGKSWCWVHVGPHMGNYYGSEETFDRISQIICYVLDMLNLGSPVLPPAPIYLAPAFFFPHSSSFRPQRHPQLP